VLQGVEKTRYERKALQEVLRKSRSDETKQTLKTIAEQLKDQESQLKTLDAQDNES